MCRCVPKFPGTKATRVDSRVHMRVHSTTENSARTTDCAFIVSSFETAIANRSEISRVRRVNSIISDKAHGLKFA